MLLFLPESVIAILVLRFLSDLSVTLPSPQVTEPACFDFRLALRAALSCFLELLSLSLEFALKESNSC